MFIYFSFEIIKNIKWKSKRDNDMHFRKANNTLICVLIEVTLNLLPNYLKIWISIKKLSKIKHLITTFFQLQR